VAEAEENVGDEAGGQTMYFDWESDEENEADKENKQLNNADDLLNSK
jgi:hypothetical protein